MMKTAVGIRMTRITTIATRSSMSVTPSSPRGEETLSPLLRDRLGAARSVPRRMTTPSFLAQAASGSATLNMVMTECAPGSADFTINRAPSVRLITLRASRGRARSEHEQQVSLARDVATNARDAAPGPGTSRETPDRDLEFQGVARKDLPCRGRRT